MPAARRPRFALDAVCTARSSASTLRYWPDRRMDPKLLDLDTLALHAGQVPDPATGARAVPIYQTTSYMFPDTDHAAGLFNLERAGHLYSRISNPTVAVLEERVAALEGGVAAVATASGQAALHLAIATLMGAGSHIVAARNLYGGSVNLLRLTLPRFGIETSFVDPRDPAAFAAAIRPETRLVLGEIVGNPGLEVLDLAAVAAVAHAHGLPLLVDSTFTTPWLCRPIEHGADIVVHSLTKWLCGHGVAIGGIVVDGGRFDWQASGRFPTLSEPYPGYAGVTYAESFGPQAFAARARTEGLRDFGACLSPQNAFYLLLGVETLPLRMERHIGNTAAVLNFLADHPDVAYVVHPSRSDHPDHELSQRLLPKGAGSIVSFGVKGGRAAGARFIEACRLASHLANVGDAKTLVIHPASTTHLQLGEEQLAAVGLRDDMIRLSVGLEHAGDIVADLDRALRAAQKP
jgi:O-acetylhomoserine (thiol)-lyase